MVGMLVSCVHRAQIRRDKRLDHQLPNGKIGRANQDNEILRDAGSERYVEDNGCVIGKLGIFMRSIKPNRESKLLIRGVVSVCETMGRLADVRIAALASGLVGQHLSRSLPLYILACSVEDARFVKWSTFGGEIFIRRLSRENSSSPFGGLGARSDPQLPSRLRGGNILMDLDQLGTLTYSLF